ncbi:fad-binding domain-containing protein [Ophiostoma piceae UAMH 11346]|uniref:Fad-binding domain-containing protein n=1 Tax=Ophiostoma piceae (strain UAMH 11346) TaxID=1262450 RepID=S3BQM7_OPHP1|nr:fad-binding domain-containing protein [Ophiostoma piceae UAMH 11346]
MDNTTHSEVGLGTVLDRPHQPCWIYCWCGHGPIDVPKTIDDIKAAVAYALFGLGGENGLHNKATVDTETNTAYLGWRASRLRFYGSLKGAVKQTARQGGFAVSENGDRIGFGSYASNGFNFLNGRADAFTNGLDDSRWGMQIYIMIGRD